MRRSRIDQRATLSLSLANYSMMAVGDFLLLQQSPETPYRRRAVGVQWRRGDESQRSSFLFSWLTRETRDAFGGVSQSLEALWVQADSGAFRICRRLTHSSSESS